MYMPKMAEISSGSPKCQENQN